MVKLIIVGLWVCAVALGSVYGAITMATNEAAPEVEVDKFAHLERLDSGMISVPVISDGYVHGYFITQVTYLMEPADLEALPISPEEMINDALITQFIGNNALDFPGMKDFDLEEFRTTLSTALNETVGREVYHRIAIKTLNYLGNENARQSDQRNRVAIQDRNGQSASN